MTPKKKINAKQITKRIFMFFDISESTADRFYWYGNALVLFGALAGAFGAIGSVWGDRVRDRFADKRMSENELKTAQANERALTLEKETVELKERTAASEKETALARKETAETLLKLEEIKKPRDITAEQRSKFIMLLKSSPKGVVNIVVGTSVNETKSYAAKIRSMLMDAGFTVPSIQMEFGFNVNPPTKSDIYLYVRDETTAPPYSVSVASAFREIGMNPLGSTPPSRPDWLKPGMLVILVGDKQ